MKMILAIVPDKLMDKLMDRCLEKKIQFTRLASSGGFLKQGNTTVILGIQEDRLDQLKGIFEDLSRDLDGAKEGIHVFYMAGDIGREF